MYDSDPHVYTSLIISVDLDFSDDPSLVPISEPPAVLPPRVVHKKPISPLLADIVPVQHQQSMKTYIHYPPAMVLPHIM